jgi:hypothetical protein
MSQCSRMEYLEKVRPRYEKASRKYKRQILDEFCENCGYERKYAIKLLKRRKRRLRQSPGPKATYGRNEQEVLERIWGHSEQMCSKRLKAGLELWIPHYEKRYGELNVFVRRNLEKISSATIDRLLASVRAKIDRRNRCGTKPGSILRTQIPIRTDNWDIKQVGFLEADTVAHCGGSLAGDFIWSITYTDILSGWTENRAVWNKGAKDVLLQTRDIEGKLPFAIKGFDCDNGGEFLNHHLVRYFLNRKSPVQFTRGRPYHKDDNAHVEQKNWSHVRQLLGYDRFENPEVLDLINDLYKNEWALLHNFFSPSFKLVSKHRIKSRYVKKYDNPKTPYQRLLVWKGLTLEKRAKLKTIYTELDPFVLADEIERKLIRIFELNRKLRKAS